MVFRPIELNDRPFRPHEDFGDRFQGRRALAGGTNGPLGRKPWLNLPVVKWAGNPIQHDLIADAKIVAPDFKTGITQHKWCARRRPTINSRCFLMVGRRSKRAGPTLH